MLLDSRNPILSTGLSEALADALSARPAAALLVTPFVHLWVAGPATPDQNSLPADFTEATFGGYAATALALPLLGPGNLDQNIIGGIMDVTFLADGTAPLPESILGYWVDNAAAGSTVMYQLETFESPVNFTTAGDFLTLQIRIPVQQVFSLTA